MYTRVLDNTTEYGQSISIVVPSNRVPAYYMDINETLHKSHLVALVCTISSGLFGFF